MRSLAKNLKGYSRLLDVGCGSGKFLYEMKIAAGCRVYGLDISEEAVKTARSAYGLEVFKGLITEAPFDLGSFDVITAWQYLEHINNPLDALRKFHYLLKPDGICVISTPNFDSFNAKIFRSKWFPLECPRHLCIYTPETVTLLLGKAGLSPVSIRFDGSSKNTLMSLQYYFYDNNYSLEHRDRVKKSSIIKALVSPLTHIFAMLGKSDNMIVFAKKLPQDRQQN